MADGIVSSPERILDAAERLFGENGIHAVSLRAITSVANVNLASVNYHFGSKEGLIAAVLARRADPINRRREELLDELLSKPGGRAPTVEEILHAFVDPAFALFDSNETFLKFVARMFLEPEVSFRQVMLRKFNGIAARFVEALHHALPDITMSELWIRFSFSVGALLHTWTSYRESTALSGAATVAVPGEKLARQWVSYAAAGLRARPAAGQTVQTAEVNL